MNTYQGAVGPQFVVTNKPFLLMSPSGPSAEFDSEQDMIEHVERVKITKPAIVFSTMYRNQAGKWLKLP